MHNFSELSDVEEPLIAFFQSLGWNTHQISENTTPHNEELGRETTTNVSMLIMLK